MNAEHKDRRRQTSRLQEIQFPRPDLPLVVSDGQPLGDCDETYVVFKEPIIRKHRRKDDPKPEPPHDMGVA
jgi:hypothetical protein